MRTTRTSRTESSIGLAKEVGAGFQLRKHRLLTSLLRWVGSRFRRRSLDRILPAIKQERTTQRPRAREARTARSSRGEFAGTSTPLRKAPEKAQERKGEERVRTLKAVVKRVEAVIRVAVEGPLTENLER